jgi:hypothetical protein
MPGAADWSTEDGPKHLVFLEGLQVGIALREGPVLWIECDGPCEMRHRFGMLAALRVGDREHVQRVVIVWILVPDESEMHECFVVPLPVDGKCGSVEPLSDALRRSFSRGDLARTDVQIKPGALEEFLFLRKTRQY